MKFAKIGMTVVLWAVVLGMAYVLFTQIDGPVRFQKGVEERSAATKNRLLDIKVAQEYYKNMNSEYANNFDDLISSLENDKLTIIKTNGDPDDTTSVVTYDTLYVSPLTEIADKKKFRGTESIKDIRFVPLTNKEKQFELATDTIKLQRVQLNVFEAKATKQNYLYGLDETRIKNPEIVDLSIGSLVSASGKGSWE